MRIVHMATAALLSLTAWADPLPKFVGVEFGQDLDVQDEAVRKAYSLKAPALVVDHEKKTSYYQCDSTGPKDGFDSFYVDVSLEKKVVAIGAELKCEDRAEAEKKRDEIAADLKKRFGDRVSENGHIVLTVAAGDGYVEVDIKGTQG